MLKRLSPISFCKFRAFAIARYYSKKNIQGHPTEMIRNVGIIAHVDHGKTTLVDCLLKQSGCMDNVDITQRLMDSNEIEKERGITILSKCTSIHKDGFHINIVDTPGHADFGGEVERILSLVDGVLLLVDASSGPQAQTKFVLSKALKQGLVPIVVQNKVDRPTARCDKVDEEILDLFLNLNANEKQLEYKTYYASAKEGYAFPSYKDIQAKGDMACIYEAIIKYVTPPVVEKDGPFKLLVNNLEANKFLGRCQMGRIESGSISVGDTVKSISESGQLLGQGKISKIFIKRGLEQISIPRAEAGDIISLAGVPFASLNCTVCDVSVTEPLKSIPIDPPTIALSFTVNDSPLSGKDGNPASVDALIQRLQTECATNVGINIGKIENGYIEVQGRGELQLGILMENMRREGRNISGFAYPSLGLEFQVSSPQVMYKYDEQGKKLEPIEELTIDVNSEYAGAIIQKLSLRQTDFISMDDDGNKTRIVFHAPTRTIMGYTTEFKNDSRGTGVINHCLLEYQPFRGTINELTKGALIAHSDGKVTDYALNGNDDKGIFFVSSGDQVYAGQVIGELFEGAHEMMLNICKCKEASNVRTIQKDEKSNAKPPKLMQLEEFLAYMKSDELLEVTPNFIRLRKKLLSIAERKRQRNQMRRENADAE